MLPVLACCAGKDDIVFKVGISEAQYAFTIRRLCLAAQSLDLCSEMKTGFLLSGGFDLSPELSTSSALLTGSPFCDRIYGRHFLVLISQIK